MYFIFGPSGCGKMSAIRYLSSKYNFEIEEIKDVSNKNS